MKPLPPLDPPTLIDLMMRLGLDGNGGEIEIDLNEEHSNSLARIRFPSGRMLVVKRARYSALATRFDTSVEASRLVHEGTDLLAPRYLEVPDLPGEPPLLVYWWIANPTLQDVWDDLDEHECARALSECGRLLQRIHAIRLAGHGALVANDVNGGPLAEFMGADLLGRLRPAVEASWPDQARSVDRLHHDFAHALPPHDGPAAVLVHNDLFTANVLCDRQQGEFHCVGVIDFEDSFAGPPEADLAKTEVLHGPLFGRVLDPDWFDRVLEGYGREVNAPFVALFRAYHLLNMGYHAAAIGLDEHSREVAQAIDRELAHWREGQRHTAVLS